MRNVLIDWWVDIVEEYNFVSGALYFSVSYIEWFLLFLCLSALCRQAQSLQLLDVSLLLLIVS